MTNAQMNTAKIDAARAFLQAQASKEATAISAPAREAIYRALQAVYANQTSDEQATQDTRHENGKGFTGVDAPFLSSVAQSSQRYGTLTAKQAKFVAKKLAKYARQIVAGVAPAASATTTAPEAQEPVAVGPARPESTPVPRMTAARTLGGSRDGKDTVDIFGRRNYVRKAQKLQSSQERADAFYNAQEKLFDQACAKLNRAMA
jgi:hypothetical protein